MAHAFHLQIISPAKMVMDAHVPQVEIPGVEGDFGVLPEHAPFFSMIRPGVINVHLGQGAYRRFFAAAGYADVTPVSCTIISDHIQDLSEITKTDAAEALKAAQDAYSLAHELHEKLAAEKLVRAAEALVDALKTLK